MHLPACGGLAKRTAFGTDRASSEVSTVSTDAGATQKTVASFVHVISTDGSVTVVLTPYVATSMPLGILCPLMEFERGTVSTHFYDNCYVTLCYFPSSALALWVPMLLSPRANDAFILLATGGCGALLYYCKLIIFFS